MQICLSKIMIDVSCLYYFLKNATRKLKFFFAWCAHFIFHSCKVFVKEYCARKQKFTFPPHAKKIGSRKVFIKEYLARQQKITFAPQAKKIGFRKVFVKNILLETTLYTSAPQAKNFFQAIRFNRNCYQINFSKKGVCIFEKKI